MPRVYKYTCDNCGFDYDIGDGKIMYVLDKEGNKIIGTHSMDYFTVHDVMRDSWGIKNADAITIKEYDEFLDQFTGELDSCICLECFKKIYLDWDSEDRNCPKCGSSNVKLIENFVGDPCPKCKNGRILKKNFGIVD